MSVETSTQKFVLLKASDKDEPLKVRLEVSHMLGNVKNMIEDLGTDNLDHVIPLSNVDYATLLKVIEYCEHYVDGPVIEADAEKTVEKTTETRNSDLNDWDKKFLPAEHKELFPLTLAANYLDIKSLLDSCCKLIASQIRNKSVEQIRETFGIVNDFEPHEEEKIRQENSWINEQ